MSQAHGFAITHLQSFEIFMGEQHVHEGTRKLITLSSPLKF